MVIQERDDFVIVTSAPGTGLLSRRAGGFVLLGPGLDPQGIPFLSLDDAITRGQAIAQSSRVSLWDATRAADPARLVISFRR